MELPPADPSSSESAENPAEEPESGSFREKSGAGGAEVNANALPPSPQGAEDLLLVRSILSKRRDQVVHFVDRLECIPRILSARNRSLGRPLTEIELDDVTQDTLAVIWRKLPKFEGRSSLETWIYRIAEFELLNAIRKRARSDGRRRVELADLELSEESPSYDDTSDLYEALEQIDTAEADVIRAKHLDGESFGLISERLGISLGTAKSRYYRGIRKMKHLLIHRQGDFES